MFSNPSYPTDDVIASLRELGAATVHEAQGGRGALCSEIKPIDPATRLSGRALTVDAAPADNLVIHFALLKARPCDVLMIDLEGKRVGTSSLKEGTAILVQRMLEAHGLNHPGDLEFSLVGAHPQRWDHLQKGTIEAGLQLIPYNYIAVEAGFTDLGAASDYVPDYAFTAIALNLDWGERNRDTAVRCLRAMREAVQWTAGNVDEAAAILRRRAHSNDEHSRRALSEIFDRNVSPIDLRINRKAIEVVFDNMHRFGLVEKDVSLSYEVCVDESFLGAA
jgi:ABC-type nitrate/sulfonate/bicarbonate transport system substrate-binding protein